ncbi:MAG: phosphatidate cytidylyltransferase [Anaerolineae bacterium]|nr:phosphatidate cytidylyltransferase [Anaerolineae bacterium]
MATLQGDASNNSARKEQKAPSNLTQRIMTVIILGPLALLLVVAGGWVFAVGVIAVAAVGVTEFYLLAQDRPAQGSTLFGVLAVIAIGSAYQLEVGHWALPILALAVILTLIVKMLSHRDLKRAAGQALTTATGILYIGFPVGFLISVRMMPDGFVWVLLILALTWGSDIFAYIGGRLFGRHPLAPTISPKKTVEGAIVGYFGGAVPSLLLLQAASQLNPATLLISLFGPIIAILGDLLESWIKRKFGVKDSHVHGLNIFPGHGGVLDRVDALIAVTAFCYFALLLARPVTG